MTSHEKVGKRALWKLVNQNLNHKIHSRHVLSVMNILFDEMKKDFLARKEVKIHNFGTFYVKQTKPGRMYDFVSKTFTNRRSIASLRLKPYHSLKKLLFRFLIREFPKKEE